jgi:hypothetical protein
LTQCTVSLARREIKLLVLPPHPDRPLWDKNRRLVIQERLDSIAAKQ